jgi:hypothetical protein
MQRWLKKRSPWGIAPKGEVAESAKITHPALEYGQGERRRVWQDAHKQGYRHILDTSGTGEGKSHDTGRLAPKSFDARQIIYISSEHRNPSTITLRDWEDLPARHKGLYRDEFNRLRRADGDQHHVVVQPNCGRNNTIAALRSKNISGADTAELVCTTCPHFEPCRAGKVFGFLNERAIALKSSRLRAHPDSLPSFDNYDYSDVVLVWEEVGTTAKGCRSLEVKDSDISQVIVDLVTKLPDTFDALRPLLTKLRQHMNGDIKQPNKFGWSNAQVRQILPELGSELDLEAIRNALTPEATGILNTTQEHEVDVADLPRGLRKKFTDSDRTTAERVANELALDWLPDFLDVFTGKTVGSLRINYGVLTITVGDERLAAIANAAKCNIYMDATATVEDVTRPLRINEQVLVTQQATPEAKNLEVIQVTGLGRLGVGPRSKFCQKRVDAAVNQIQQEALGDVAVIDFKRHTQEGDGKRNWWVDSRGVNDLERCQTLILVGTPCQTLSQLEAEFTVLYGRSPQDGKKQVRYPIKVEGQPEGDSQEYLEMDASADPEFREFVRRKILADFHQAIGRLRAHRRPGEKLKVYVVADYPLDIPVKLIEASEITLEAANKKEQTVMAIKQAVAQLEAEGKKITQTAVAELTGLTQGYISKLKKVFQTLLDDPYSKSNNFADPPPDPDEAKWVSQEYLPLLAEESPEEMLKGVLGTFEVYGQATFKAICDVIPVASRIKILKGLFKALPQAELNSLAVLLGIEEVDLGGRSQTTEAFRSKLGQNKPEFLGVYQGIP